jgi:hypothetical protein
MSGLERMAMLAAMSAGMSMPIVLRETRYDDGDWTGFSQRDRVIRPRKSKRKPPAVVKRRKANRAARKARRHP